MQNTIIIIESPNKIEKIKKITGAEVYATKGHFKRLKKDFLEDYKNYNPIFEYKDENTKKSMNYIFSKCKGKEVIIATDPDREGYGIGYMVYEVIKNVANSVKRAEFFEITENGITKGLQNAIPFSQSNLKMYDSFKARLVGDKMIGFILSPKYAQILKDKKTGVGRVQTPALNFIVKRELEIQQYNTLPLNQKIDYKISIKSLKDNIEFIIKSENIYNNKEEALKIIENLKSLNTAMCYEIKLKDSKQSPKAPFRTSQLQEEANKSYKFTSESTMQYAQKLFEKGLITYHRTDSNSLSDEFLEEVKNKFSQEEWYQMREYKAGKQSQAEAHEAIRITHAHTSGEMQAIINENNLSNEEVKLYKLIYQNSIASQAKDCIKEIKDYIFNIKGMLFKFTNSKIIYKGFKGIFEDDINTEEKREDENSLKIDFNQNDNINLLDYSLVEIKKNQPKRYKESNFISLLEKEGIGRPSTYASFLKTLLEKECVALDTKGEIAPTQKGFNLIEALMQNNDEWITTSEFTKQMELVLDKIALNELHYLNFIQPIHEKMNFLEIESNVNMPPSPKQIKFLEDLAKEQGVEIPKVAYENYKECKTLIEKLSKSNKKPPSEKQIKLAEDLAKKHNLNLPKDYKEYWKSCSDFLDKVFNEAKSNTHK